MKYTRIIMLLIISLIATAMKSQDWKKLKNEDGVVIDSVFVPEFPHSIPIEFTYLYFQKVVEAKLHDNRIDLIFDNILENQRTRLTDDDIRYYRRALAIYYTETNIDKSVLWRQGNAVSSVSFSPDRDGRYTVILMKNDNDVIETVSSFLGKVFMVDISGDDVVIHTALQPD